MKAAACVGGVTAGTGPANLLLSQTFDNLSEIGAYVDEWERVDPRSGGAPAP